MIYIQGLILITALIVSLKCKLENRTLDGIFWLIYAWILYDSLGLLTWAALKQAGVE